MSGITDTKKTMVETVFLSMVVGSTAAIELQESTGHHEMVASELLPTDMGGERAMFEAMGFVFGNVVKDDPMFIDATLPKGWSKRHTDHSMWSEIIDEQGRKRASIFYKAAFYDRNAFMSLCGRYKVVGPYSDDSTGPREARIVDLKTGEVLHVLTRDAGPEAWRTANMNANDAAGEWLKEHIPTFSDPLEWLKD